MLAIGETGDRVVIEKEAMIAVITAEITVAVVVEEEIIEDKLAASRERMSRGLQNK